MTLLHITSHSVIKATIADKLCHIIKLDEPIPLKLANGETLIATRSCRFATTLKGEHKEKCPLTGTALVLPDFKGTHKEDMIIGVPELQTYQIGLKFHPKGKDKIDLSRCVRREASI